VPSTSDRRPSPSTQSGSVGMFLPPGLVFIPYPNRYRAPFHRGPGPFDDTAVARDLLHRRAQEAKQ